MSSDNTRNTTLSIGQLNKKLFLLVLCLVCIFIVAEIIATSTVGTKSVEINSVRMEKDELRLETELLKSQINEEKTTKKLESIIGKLELVPKKVTQLNSRDDSGIAYSGK